MHIDVVSSSTIQEFLVSAYNLVQIHDRSDVHSGPEIKDIFHSVVVSNVDSMSSPSILCAAVMEHI